MHLLPNAKAQFIDSGGQPLANGTVGFYFPGTLNPKATFQDSAGTIANPNPVPLDSRGQALIWGSGVYRQILKDASGVTIWDQITEDSNAGLTGNLTDAVFIAGTDFTPGTTAQLTLPVTPGSIANTWIFFDATYQDDAQASVNGTTLTFNSPIPIGVGKVTVKIGTTIAIGTPGTGTVSDDSVAANAAINSSKLSFLQSGAGAIARTVQSKLQDVLSIEDFGALQTATDNTNAFHLAANACNALGGGTVFVPCGTWKVAGTITMYPNVQFVGEDEFSSIIVPTTINGTLFSFVNSSITAARCAVRNLTIAPSVSGVTGIQLTLCQFTAITDVNFIGCSQNFVIDRGFFHTIQNILSEGSATLAAGSCTLTSTVDNDYITHVSFENYMLVNQGTGVPNIGIYMRRAINVEMTDLHLYAGAPNCTFLIIENDSQGVKVKGMMVNGAGAGAILRQGTGVAVVPSFTSFTACHVDQPQAFGIQVNGAICTSFTDVMFTPNPSFVTIPALFLVGAQETIVNGCLFSNFNGVGGAGIQFVGSDTTTIENCIFLGCTGGVNFSGSVTNCTVGSNNIYKSTTAIGGSPAGTGNRIQPNQIGLTPNATFVPPTPSFPASGTPFTNNTAFSCRVFISGGTFTAVNLNGTSMSASSFWTGEVQPGETIAITYSAVPAWTWVGK